MKPPLLPFDEPESLSDDELRDQARKDLLREHQDARIAEGERQSKVRAALAESAERERKRKLRARRLIDVGLTVESIWGDSVDNSVLAGVLSQAIPAKLSPGDTEAFREVTRRRFADRAAYKLPPHRFRVAFPVVPPEPLRLALKGEGYQFRKVIAAWIGNVQLSAELERTVDTHAGIIVEVDPEEQKERSSPRKK